MRNILKISQQAKAPLFAVMLMAVLSLTNIGFCAYTTPGTGVTWTLDDLASHSGEALTGPNPNYALTDAIYIAEGDTLSVTPEAAVTIDCVVTASLNISGTLVIQGADEHPVLLTNSSGQLLGRRLRSRARQCEFVLCANKVRRIWGRSFGQSDRDRQQAASLTTA